MASNKRLIKINYVFLTISAISLISAFILAEYVQEDIYALLALGISITFAFIAFIITVAIAAGD